MIRPYVTARPRLPRDGQVPRAKPEAELSRPRMPEPARPTIKQLERGEAVAELDRICAARPLKPPPLPAYNPTRSAGACELAREIRRGNFTR